MDQKEFDEHVGRYLSRMFARTIVFVIVFFGAVALYEIIRVML